jgi:hypothetical protein
MSSIAGHLFSTRHLQVPGAHDEDGEGWAELAATVGVEPYALVRLRQVHGAAVFESSIGARPPAAYDDWPEADIAISNDRSVALTVRAADCVPLLLADRTTGAAAAVHAGWRGTAAGAAVVAVAALGRAFGTRPADLVAAVGPSIGPCCYTVGEELVEPFSAHPEASSWFHRAPRQARGALAPPPGAPASLDEAQEREVRSTPKGDAGGLILDLWRATRDQLLRAGLAPEDIHVAELCTASHPDLFHSYRRDGKAAGRLVAVTRPR